MVWNQELIKKMMIIQKTTKMTEKTKLTKMALNYKINKNKFKINKIYNLFLVY